MGLADVLLDPQFVWPALLVLRGVSLVAEGHPAAVAFVAAGLLVRLRWRLGNMTAAVVGFAGPVLAVPSTYNTLIGLVATAFVLFSGRQLETVLRVQVVVVYAFAAANKLSPGFLSGEVLAWTAPWLPAPGLVAPLVVAAEAALAVAVWRRWPAALPAAVLVHAGIVAGTAMSLAHLGSLVAYNGTVVWLVWLVTARTCRPTTPLGQRAPQGSAPPRR